MVCQRLRGGPILGIVAASRPQSTEGSIMLTLTENASSAVKNLASQIPTETGGLRIAEAADPQNGYALSLASAPEEGDTVVESDGARVFVDQAASVALDDRILDARVQEDGAVGFALAQAV